MLPNETNPASPQPQPFGEPQPAKKKKTVLYVAIGIALAAIIAAVLFIVDPGGKFSSFNDDSDGSATAVITSEGFEPQTIKIKKGQTVEWINEDTASHTVASDPFPSHTLLPHLVTDSPLGNGESFTFTFEDTGTYTYHDRLHPADFKGTVIVE